MWLQRREKKAGAETARECEGKKKERKAMKHLVEEEESTKAKKKKEEVKRVAY